MKDLQCDSSCLNFVGNAFFLQQKKVYIYFFYFSLDSFQSQLTHNIIVNDDFLSVKAEVCVHTRGCASVFSFFFPPLPLL